MNIDRDRIEELHQQIDRAHRDGNDLAQTATELLLKVETLHNLLDTYDEDGDQIPVTSLRLILAGP